LDQSHAQRSEHGEDPPVVSIARLVQAAATREAATARGEPDFILSSLHYFPSLTSAFCRATRGILTTSCAEGADQPLKMTGLLPQGAEFRRTKTRLVDSFGDVALPGAVIPLLPPAGTALHPVADSG